MGEWPGVSESPQERFGIRRCDEPARPHTLFCPTAEERSKKGEVLVLTPGKCWCQGEG